MKLINNEDISITNSGNFGVMGSLEGVKCQTNKTSKTIL